MYTCPEQGVVVDVLKETSHRSADTADAIALPRPARSVLGVTLMCDNTPCSAILRHITPFSILRHFHIERDSLLRLPCQLVVQLGCHAHPAGQCSLQQLHLERKQRAVHPLGVLHLEVGDHLPELCTAQHDKKRQASRSSNPTLSTQRVGQRSNHCPQFWRASLKLYMTNTTDCKI